ncbi:hypothetical protein [Aeromonas aquatica]|uniref:hypothetical protein n=1 Tax=Aeromonas aquatica TaxID=558964 RepID=UPI00051AD97E|nr:hypothetical protein [Aeromonas aquatica]
MAGGNFELLFDRAALQGLIATLEATGSEVTKAANRAAERTMRSVRSGVAKEVAKAHGIPVKMLTNRITLKSYKGEDPVWILFVGINRMPVDVADPNVKQTEAGLSHKGGMVKGGFYQDVFHHGRKGWIRKKRARELGLKLPGLDGPGSGVNIDGRFPVIRISHDLATITTPIFRRYQKIATRTFEARFEHELKHIKGMT